MTVEQPRPESFAGQERPHRRGGRIVKSGRASTAPRSLKAQGRRTQRRRLAILLVVGLYLAIGLWIVIKSPGWWRLVALLAVILIPTGDAMWGRYVALPRLCKDAGLKVYAKATKDGGLLFDGAADDYYLVKYGFPFVEGQDAAGTYYRFSRSEEKIRLCLREAFGRSPSTSAGLCT